MYRFRTSAGEAELARLDTEAAWAMIDGAHVATLTSLRRDGWPIALPVWFACLDRILYVRTSPTSAKAKRLARDERASFLVEEGTAWRELRAVSLPVRARLLDPEVDGRAEAALRAIWTKYRDLRERRTDLPPTTVRRYDERGTVVVELVPTGPPIAWDNRLIQLGERA